MKEIKLKMEFRRWRKRQYQNQNRNELPMNISGVTEAHLKRIDSVLKWALSYPLCTAKPATSQNRILKNRSNFSQSKFFMKMIVETLRSLSITSPVWSFPKLFHIRPFNANKNSEPDGSIHWPIRDNPFNLNKKTSSQIVCHLDFCRSLLLLMLWNMQQKHKVYKWPKRLCPIFPES